MNELLRNFLFFAMGCGIGYILYYFFRYLFFRGSKRIGGKNEKNK